MTEDQNKINKNHQKLYQIELSWDSTENGKTGNDKTGNGETGNEETGNGNQMIASKQETPDPNYWRSFEELYNDPEALEESHHEFKEGVTDDFNPSEMSPLSRRKFLALLGASAALAGAGCADYRDKKEIVPYVKRPEEVLPGKPTYYASTCNACSNGCGILIKTREGRPIKVDGNPDHPVSKGKICSKGHAHILNLYNPERLKNPMKGQKGELKDAAWDTVDSEIINELNKAGRKQIAVITNKIISPTGKKVLDDFALRFPSARIYSYELFNEELRNSAWKKIYGTGEFPLIKWDEAKIIVALESDFLGTEGNVVENARLFSMGKDIMNVKNFNRLYTIEGNLSLTGMNADYRLRLSPDAQLEFVLSLFNEISARIGSGNLSGYSLSTFVQKHSLDPKKVSHLVEDLISNRGASIIYAGRTLPEDVHIAVSQLNGILGNTNLYRTDVSAVNLLPLASQDEWASLIDAMNDSGVAAVIHYGSNPAYHLPSDLGYKEALKKVSNVITLSEIINESCSISDYVLPINHDFESWGDAKTRTGFYSLQQPVIWPIFNTKQKEAVLLTWIIGKEEKDRTKIYHNYLMKNWETAVYPAVDSPLDFKQFWFAALHDGVVFTSEPAAGSFNPSYISVFSGKKEENTGFTVALKESHSLGDGRFADNGWLQELPNPVTKVTWDNYASISKKTADELGIDTNDLIEINVDNRKLIIPAIIQPGSSDKTITIELGYGREKAGVVGINVGFNANVLMTKNPGPSPWIFTNADVKKLSDSHKLATTQEHHAFDRGYTKDPANRRGLIRTGSLEEFKKDPNFLKGEKGLEEKTFYGQHLKTLYTGTKWGMSIDLNKCLGCGECIVACSSENNVPVVGRDQVLKSREMQWIRVDRYYSGTYEEPEVFNQVMLCQQCDHAPCENVCPVAATTHSNDGLNQMAYNRCVGTRYCSNNCPYKVRRFNFYNFRNHFKDSYQESGIFALLNNPEVTVRSRGVMEKCTFCVQRIMDERENAIREDRPVNGANVKTACQDACITDAIKFGNENEKNSSENEYNKYKDHPLGYYMLEELNTRPNVTYIAKLKNTHPEES
ncbi:MAG TPA: TAT-variant-translocated molybdopterin oxidoreductase [Ignavibacteriaceae bacterium]|nr:TAT-variant-translocated molybdopterin oxidoreductase [Ignavibacteriaceae bacterium]